MKIAISITCHESVECIIDQCKNIKSFVIEPIVVIHVNISSNAIYTQLIEVIKNSPELQEYIIISPFRVNTGKDKFSLHKAHILNLRYIRLQAIEFDYFLIEASNSLFVKLGIEKFISSFDIGIGMAKPSGYWAEKIHMHKSLDIIAKRVASQYNNEIQIHKGCHEGAYFKSTHVDNIFNIASAIDDFCAVNDDKPNYPTEEIWFQMAVSIYSMTNSIKMSGTITYLPWERGLIWTIQDINDFLKNDEYQHKFAIKRIERNINDSQRKFIKSLTKE